MLDTKTMPAAGADRQRATAKNTSHITGRGAKKSTYRFLGPVWPAWGPDFAERRWRGWNSADAWGPAVEIPGEPEPRSREDLASDLIDRLERCVRALEAAVADRRAEAADLALDRTCGVGVALK